MIESSDNVSAATGTATASPSPAASRAGAGDRQGRSSKIGLFVVLGLLVVPVVVLLGALAWPQGADSTEFRYVVPLGSGSRAAQGQTVEIMPSELQVEVGDHLVIENQDIFPVTAGPFTVRAGETFEYRFSEPGELIGLCTVGEGGEIRIVVT